MGEHLDLDQLAARTAYVVRDDPVADPGHLFERQFACENHRVGPLCIELHGLRVGDVALRRDVHLDARPAGIEDDGHVRGDDGIDALALRPVDHLVGRGDLVFVDDRIDRQVGAHTGGMCRRYDARQVVEREVGGRCRPHVEFPDPEVDGVGAGLDGCGERFVAPHGSHDFDIGAFQGSGSF